MIINTSATDPYASAFKNPWRSKSYASRYEILKEKVLPAALAEGFDEVIVVGNFEPGEGYQYLPMEPVVRARMNALHQRELGARHATGDILVFGHDDHAVGEGFGDKLRGYQLPWDLLVPKRVHGVTGEELDNGSLRLYMGGHVLAMKRWLWARVPWTAVATDYWDTSMTREWQAAGANLVWDTDLTHIDVEATADES